MNRLNSLTRNGEIPLATALARETLTRAWNRRSVRAAAGRVFGVREPRGVAFLCGCFNSGTTILREILGSHPEIRAMPREGVVYTDRLTDYEVGEWTRLFCDRERIERFNREQFATLEASDLLRDWMPWVHPGSIFLEKSVSNTARMVELQSVFTNAAFIVIERQPHSVVEGIVRRSRRVRPGDRLAPDHEAGMKQWILCRKLISDQVNQLRRVYRFSYEDFIAQPDFHLRRILAMLGVDQTVERTASGVRIGGRTWTLVDGNEKSRRALAPEVAAAIDRAWAELETDS